MDLIVSKTSPMPIYEQITSQIEALIVSGELKVGDRLPSIRSLANGLDVSVITTKRAYADLEQSGLIESVQGRGCFISDRGSDAIQMERRRQVAEALDKTMELAGSAGMSKDEVQELLDRALKDYQA